jgi:hypothetical protein
MTSRDESSAVPLPDPQAWDLLDAAENMSRGGHFHQADAIIDQVVVMSGVPEHPQSSSAEAHAILGRALLLRARNKLRRWITVNTWWGRHFNRQLLGEATNDLTEAVMHLRNCTTRRDLESEALHDLVDCYLFSRALLAAWGSALRIVTIRKWSPEYYSPDWHRLVMVFLAAPLTPLFTARYRVVLGASEDRLNRP